MILRRNGPGQIGIVGPNIDKLAPLASVDLDSQGLCPLEKPDLQIPRPHTDIPPTNILPRQPNISTAHRLQMGLSRPLPATGAIGNS